MNNVSLIDGHIDNADRCVMCGEFVPEGRHVCSNCEKRIGKNMINIQIISFKRGFLWYACCEIPPVDPTIYYCDNNRYITMCSPITIHAVALSHNRVTNKMIHKLKLYFNEKGNKND